MWLFKWMYIIIKYIVQTLVKFTSSGMQLLRGHMWLVTSCWTVKSFLLL